MMPADKGENRKSGASCISVTGRLIDYVDSTLSAADRKEVEAHLSQCSCCRLELAHIRRVESALSTALDAVPPPGDLYAGFARKLEAQQPASRGIQWLRLAPVLGAALAAIILVDRLNAPEHTPLVATSQSLSARHGKESKPVELLTYNSLSSSSLGKVANAAPSDTRLGTRFKSTAGESQIRVALRGTGMVHNRRGGTDQFIATPDPYRLAVAPKRPRTSLSVGASSKPAIPDIKEADAMVLAYNVPGAGGESAGRVPSALNEYRDQARLSKDIEAEGVRRYAAPGRDTSRAEGFTLVVQDDVRGFIAESHEAVYEESRGLRGAGIPGDGIKIEVELDDDNGNSISSGSTGTPGQISQ